MSTPLESSPLSPHDAEIYYHGLVGAPCLAGQSGSDGIQIQDGPFRYPVQKYLTDVGNHPIRAVWLEVSRVVLQRLGNLVSAGFQSLSLVGIGNEGEPPKVTIWIGVRPACLSMNEGDALAQRIWNEVCETDFPDVQVQFRESIHVMF